MTVHPANASRVVDGETRSFELTALLQHPSLRFLNELVLAGPLPHAKVWLTALQRYGPPALRRITTASITSTDAVAVDIAFRFPRWTWVWSTPTAPSGGLFKRLFGG